jgi:hypothetical protein
MMRSIAPKILPATLIIGRTASRVNRKNEKMRRTVRRKNRQKAKIILASLPKIRILVSSRGDGPLAIKKGNLIMTKEKTVERNYSEAQEAEMLAAGIIDNAKALEFAAKFDKDIKSVRAKAVRMGIYKAAEKVSKTGGKVESKEKIVSDISAIVGKSLEGLEKAPKLVLQIIRTKLSA